jgi:hypothetical protein
VDYDIHLVCLVLQELAVAGLVRSEKADGPPAEEESEVSIPILLIRTGFVRRSVFNLTNRVLACGALASATSSSA